MISCLPSYKLRRRDAIALTSSALVVVLVRVLKEVFLIAQFVTRTHTCTQLQRHSFATKAPDSHPLRGARTPPLHVPPPFKKKKKKKKKPFFFPPPSPQTHSGAQQRKRGANKKSAQQQQKQKIRFPCLQIQTDSGWREWNPGEWKRKRSWGAGRLAAVDWEEIRADSRCVKSSERWSCCARCWPTHWIAAF